MKPEDMRNYFENASGLGVLGTADAQGQVDMAVYSRPFFEDADSDQLHFIMADRKSYANISENPQAAYLFHEDGEGYKGCRLFLTKVAESQDSERINALMNAREYRFTRPGEEAGMRLVSFRIDQVLPLVGAQVASGAS